MRRFTCFLFSLLSILAFAAPAGAAADDPSAALRKILSRLKDAGKPTAILGDVHWPTVFAQLSPSDRRSMHAATPEQLRAHYQRLWTDPGEVLKEAFRSRVEQLSEEQQVMMEEQ
ncbi:MAG: hypothetical protein KDD44_11185, partial [Bdellovibrionales bacterium]|nr:hypothetical protein [Bdellovibrionales bacterium]